MFNTLFYAPLYNTMVWLIDVIPSHDAGIALVILTLFVSVLLFSLSKKSIKTQIAMKEIEPELAKIKAIESKEEQAKQTMALYKKHKVNPFSVILILLIQFPILIALYYVFYNGFPEIHTDVLYSFIKVPEAVNMMFLGLIDLTQKSVFLAILAGVTQYVQAAILTSYNKPKPLVEGQKRTMQEEFANSMQTQMKYFLPVMIGGISLTLPAALPLYWSVRNLFTAAQEVFIRRRLKRD